MLYDYWKKNAFFITAGFTIMYIYIIQQLLVFSLEMSGQKASTGALLESRSATL